MDVDDLMKEYVNKIKEKIMEQREEILRAFIAKYGCGPDELVQFTENTPNGTKWWVERRNS